MILIAIASTKTALESFLIALAALLTFPSGNRFTAATRAPKPTTMEIKPTPISSQDIVLMIFRAIAKTKSADAKPIMAVVNLTTPFGLLSLLKIAIAPNNSPNNEVIATRAVANFSDGIKDNTRSEAAKIAIAIAIFLRVSAFIESVKAPNASETPPRTSLILSTTLLPSENKSPPPLKNLAIPTPIAAMIPPLRTSNTLS